MSNHPAIIVSNISNDEMILHSPIKFTASGINCFLKHTYNHPKYASDIVPHNTGHFMQLLEHGSSTKQDHDYMIAVIRLFRQKISAANYISAAETERITTFVPTILANYLDLKQARHNRSACRKLKRLMVHLVENCLAKTLWDCENQELMTTQCLKIGNNLENMHHANIITDQDDLNDMVHMLIDRFIYVVGLAGTNLPISFYEELKKQLNLASWMHIAEIEDLVDTKLQKINNAFLTSKIKSHAAEAFGIL